MTEDKRPDENEDIQPDETVPKKVDSEQSAEDSSGPETEVKKDETDPSIDKTVLDGSEETLKDSNELQVKSYKSGEEPSKIGKYDIVRTLGKGGMGMVYLARDPGLQREVALKTMIAGEDASEEAISRFMAEARSAGKLQHPNIVGVHEVGEERALHYLVMDYIEGFSLKELMALSKGERESHTPASGHPSQEGNRELTPRRSAEIIRDIAAALHYAHENGIIHRDLKPGNIMLKEDGTAFLTDFGLARNLASDSSLTKTGQVMGTPTYLNPEQADDSRKVDARSDVYSLGAVFYHLLTGETPVKGENLMNIIYQVMEREAVRPTKVNPKIAKDLEIICMKAMVKEADRRYQTAQAFADDLTRYLDGEPISARPVSILYRIGKKVKRSKTAVLTTSLITVLVAFGAYGWVLWEKQRQEAREAELEQARHRVQIEREDERKRFREEQEKNRLRFEAEQEKARKEKERIAAELAAKLQLIKLEEAKEKRQWDVIYEQDFDDIKELGDEWDTSMAGRLRDKALFVRGTRGGVIAWLNIPIKDNEWKFEYDGWAAPGTGTLNDIGLMVKADRNVGIFFRSGFEVQFGGKNNVVSGIYLQGKPVFSISRPNTIEHRHVYHFTVSYRGGILKYHVKDMTADKVVLDREAEIADINMSVDDQRHGFWTWGSEIFIDNIVISKMGTSQKKTALVVAEELWGQFGAEVAVDYVLKRIDELTDAKEKAAFYKETIKMCLNARLKEQQAMANRVISFYPKVFGIRKFEDVFDETVLGDFLYLCVVQGGADKIEDEKLRKAIQTIEGYADQKAQYRQRRFKVMRKEFFELKAAEKYAEAIALIRDMAAGSDDDPDLKSEALREWACVLLVKDREAGAKKFREAIAADPVSGTTWLTWGSRLQELGDLEAAGRVFKEGTGEVLDSQPLWSAHAGILKSLGRNKEAHEVYALATASMPENPTLWKEWGQLFDHEGRADEALPRFVKAAEFPSKDYRFFIDLALRFEKKKDFEAALDVCRKGVIAYPTYAWYWTKIHACLKKLGREHEFDAELARYLHPEMTDVDRLDALGDIYARIGRKEDADKAYGRAVKINKYHPGIWRNWAFQYRQDDIQRANQIMAEGARLNPNSTYLYREWGWLHYVSRDFPEAIRMYKKSLELDPNYVGSHKGLGNVYQETKDFELALAAYDKALALTPRDTYVLAAKAESLKGLKRYAEAVAVYEKVAAIKPTHYRLWIGLGLIYAAMEDVEKEQATYARGATFKPGDYALWLAWARSLAKAGRNEEALAKVKTAWQRVTRTGWQWSNFNTSIAGLYGLSPEFGRLLIEADFLDAAQRDQGLTVLRKAKKYTQALALANVIIAKDPAHSQAWAEKILILHLMDDAAGSKAALQEAAKRGLAAGELWKKLGASLRSQRDKKIITGLAGRFANIYPDNASAWSDWGQGLYQMNRYAEAIKKYEESLKRDPDLYLTHYRLAEARLMLKRYPQSIASAERALELRPGYTGALVALGRACAAIGELEKGLKAYEQVCATSSYHLYWCARGDLLSRLGRNIEAIDMYEAALRNPQGRQTYIWGRMKLAALSEPDSVRKLQIYDQLIKDHPLRKDGYLGKGAALLGMNELGGAVDVYETCLKQFPDDNTVWVSWANELVKIKRTGDAMALMARAAQTRPDDPYIWNHWAVLLLKAKDLESGRRKHARAVSLTLTKPAVYITWADALAQEGLLAEALACLEKGLAGIPGHPDLLLAQAWIVYDLEEYIKAAAICEALAEKNPKDFAARFLLLQALVAGAQYDRLLARAQELMSDPSPYIQYRGRFFSAWALEGKGEYERALELCNDAINYSDGDAVALGIREVCLFHLKRPAMDKDLAGILGETKVGPYAVMLGGYHYARALILRDRKAEARGVLEKIVKAGYLTTDTWMKKQVEAMLRECGEEKD